MLDDMSLLLMATPSIFIAKFGFFPFDVRHDVKALSLT